MIDITKWAEYILAAQGMDDGEYHCPFCWGGGDPFDHTEGCPYPEARSLLMPYIADYRQRLELLARCSDEEQNRICRVVQALEGQWTLVVDASFTFASPPSKYADVIHVMQQQSLCGTDDSLSPCISRAVYTSELCEGCQKTALFKKAVVEGKITTA